jgi:CRP-like cAMP-binding protein
MNPPGADRMPTNSLLRALQNEQRRALEPHLQEVRLRRGDVLGEPDEPITHVHFPNDAVISLTVPTLNGDTAEAATIGREGMVGFVAAFADRRAFARSLVQVTGTASRLPLTKLEAAFKAHPAIREICLAYIQVLLGQVLQSVACGTLHPAEMRLARWLLMLHDRAARDELRLTQDFLADMLGVRRATVALSLRAMREDGLVAQRRGRIVILDRKGLEARSCECYRIVQAYHARVLPYGFS